MGGGWGGGRGEAMAGGDGCPLPWGEDREGIGAGPWESRSATASGHEGVVLIEHRDKEERAALVAESHLRALYRTIEELRSRSAEPFRLEGSMVARGSEEDLDDALRAVRRDWSRRVPSDF